MTIHRDPKEDTVVDTLQQTVADMFNVLDDSPAGGLPGHVAIRARREHQGETVLHVGGRRYQVQFHEVR